MFLIFFFFSSRRRHTRYWRDWSSDVCSSDLYRKAAQRIRETPGPVAQMALEGRAKGLQGIGKTIEGKIVEIVEDGEIHALTKKKGVVPSELAEFIRLPGLG